MNEDRGPLLGALFRLARQEVVNAIEAALREHGHDDIRPSHFPLTQFLWDHPDDARLTDAAAYAGVTKQSMSEVVADLEAARYLERRTDPADRRASVLHLTPKGRRLVVLVRATVHAVEKRWEERIGAKRIDQLRQIMRALVQTETA